MEIIAIGIFRKEDKKELNSTCNMLEGLEIAWDYSKFNFESSGGLEMMKTAYGLMDIGILLPHNRGVSFTSYPLIYEVTESVLGKSDYPLLFKFLDSLNELKIEKSIIAFADEWDADTLVRVESLDMNSLKDKLNNVFVWCENYVDLSSNHEIRVADHPLIIESW